jgi:hypothetical protein
MVYRIGRVEISVAMPRNLLVSWILSYIVLRFLIFAGIKKLASRQSISGLMGFGGERRGSNPRHPEPQSGALPTELRPP